MTDNFTMARAEALVKQELGFHVPLKQPEELNQSTAHPRFQGSCGSQQFDIYIGHKEDIVVFETHHMNSDQVTCEYFFADNLEYAKDFTEARLFKEHHQMLNTAVGVSPENRLQRLWDLSDKSEKSIEAHRQEMHDGGSLKSRIQSAESRTVAHPHEEQLQKDMQR